MLSNIGRAAIRRVGAGIFKSSTPRIGQSIWYVTRVDASSSSNNASARAQSSFPVRRSYATATKATQTATPKAKKSPAAKPKTKAATAKKAGKGPLKKKAAAKPKPKAKRAAKPVLTAEQKLKAEIKELKGIALSPPKPKPDSTWQVLLAEYMQEKAGGTRGSGEDGRQLFTGIAKEASAKYKSLGGSELEQYNHKANQNRVENDAALKKWVESHTPDQIRLANNARKLLKKKTGSLSRYTLLPDERIPKKPVRAWMLFGKERWASGDFKGLKPTETPGIIVKEWQALPASERKPFEDREEADRQRYLHEFKTVFHRDPEFRQHKAASA